MKSLTSIVRGTTSKRIIKQLRDFGAREIHVRIASPQIISPCFYGVDISTYDELRSIYELTAKINLKLQKLFQLIGVKLVDFKVEYGKTADGEIVLADEISPDCCRLWDAKTNDHLDKDRFRRDLGDVMGGYVEIYNRLSEALKK